MLDRPCPSVSRRLSITIAAIGSFSGAIALDLAAPSLAHNIKTDGEVGATFHLEPNHNPKSGEPATVWFALTREGGETIPLADCDCELSVVNQQDESIEVDAPELTAIDVETYTDIPSAEIVFPEPGVYALTIGGAASDTASEDFSDFELTYDVTVRPGAANAAEEAEDSDAENDTENDTDNDTDSDADAPSSTAADGETADTDEKPFVDTWIWLIGSLVLLGVGGLLGTFALLRWIWASIMKRLKKKSPVSSDVASGSVSTAESASDSATAIAASILKQAERTSTAEPSSAIASDAIAANEIAAPSEAEPFAQPKSPSPTPSEPEDAAKPNAASDSESGESNGKSDSESGGESGGESGKSSKDSISSIKNWD